MSFIDKNKNFNHIKMIYATLKYGDFRWISMASKKLVSCPNLSFIEWIDYLIKNKDICYNTLQKTIRNV